MTTSPEKRKHGRPKSPYRQKEFMDQLVEMRKTLSWDAVAERTGLCRRFLQTLVAEEVDTSGDVFKPRVLRAWPAGVDFKPDELEVRT